MLHNRCTKICESCVSCCDNCGRNHHVVWNCECRAWKWINSEKDEAEEFDAESYSRERGKERKRLFIKSAKTRRTISNFNLYGYNHDFLVNLCNSIYGKYKPRFACFQELQEARLPWWKHYVPRFLLSRESQDEMLFQFCEATRFMQEYLTMTDLVLNDVPKASELRKAFADNFGEYTPPEATVRNSVSGCVWRSGRRCSGSQLA